MYFCPNCQSANIVSERRLYGDSICNNCGYKDKTEKFLPEPLLTKAECPPYVFRKSLIKDIMDYLHTKPYNEVKHLMSELEFAAEESE